MEDKQIKLSVDSSGVSQGANTAKSALQSMYEEMERHAMARSRSAKEAIKDIEDQIKAQERLNQLQSLEGRIDVRERLSRGEISGGQATAELRDISIESDKEKLNTQLLKDILYQLIDNASEERKISDEEFERLSIKDDRDLSLKEKIYKEKIYKERLEEGSEEEGGKKKSNRGRGGLGLFSTITGTNNEYSLVSSLIGEGSRRMIPDKQENITDKLLGVGGLIGMALAAAGGMSISRANPYLEQLSGTAGLTGLSKESLHGNFNGWSGRASDMGFDLTEQARSATAIGKAGGWGGLSSDIIDFMEMKRLGVDEGSLLSIERLKRSDSSGKNLKGIVGGLNASMEGIGAKSGGSMFVEEYLNIIASIGQEQLKTLGSVDMGVNTKLVTAVASMGDKFKNADFLKGIVQSLKSGSTAAPNEQYEALQMMVLSSMPGNENLSPLELLKKREAGGNDYVAAYAKALAGIGGEGSEQAVYATKGAYGGSFTNASDIVGNIGKFIETLNTNFGEKAMGDVVTTTSELMRSQVEINNLFIKSGKELVSAIESLKSFIKSRTK